MFAAGPALSPHRCFNTCNSHRDGSTIFVAHPIYVSYVSIYIYDLWLQWSSGALNTARSSWRLFKNGESVTVTQRKFRLHFNVARHRRIPSRNTIFLLVHNFRTTASATKKQGGSARTVRNTESVEAVRNAVEQSPRRFAVGYATRKLRLSDTTVRRILHKDLSFHPYK